MICRISALPDFKKELKHLRKKYPSIQEDLALLLNSLQENPLQGANLGNGIRKVRMAITSKGKGKGKSGGARVITLTALISVEEADVLLLSIYDKSEKETITNEEIQERLRNSELHNS